MTEHWFGIGLIGLGGLIMHEECRRGHVIHMQKFAPWRARTSNSNLALRSLDRFMEPTDKAGKNM